MFAIEGVWETIFDWLSKDLGPRLVAIFNSSRGSEATSKAIGIKYTYDEGSESNNNLSPKFFDFGSPVGGIREGKSHTLHPPSANAYGVGGLEMIHDVA